MDRAMPLRLDRGVPPSAADRAVLLSTLAGRKRRYDPGDIVTHEGDTDGDLVLVTSGWACRCRQLEDGGRVLVTLAVPGEILDFSTLFGMSSPFSTQALTPVMTASVGHEALTRILATRPGLQRSLLAEACMESAAQLEALVGIGRRNAAERVSQVIYDTVVRAMAAGLCDGHSIVMPTTQADIGDMVGLTTVHVNRTFHTLRQEGLIEALGRRIVIPDLEALRVRARLDPAYLALPRPTPALPHMAETWEPPRLR